MPLEPAQAAGPEPGARLLMFGLRVTRLFEHVHPQWRHAAALDLQAVHPHAQPRVAALAFQRLCGALPTPQALAHGPGVWCMLPTEEMLRRLALFGLARRPGALRGCLRRADREALAQLAGPALEVLRERSLGSPIVGLASGQWTLEHWALQGHRDLVRAGAWPTRSLRRWARLALPARCGGGHLPADGHRSAANDLSDVDAWLGAADAVCP